MHGLTPTKTWCKLAPSHLNVAKILEVRFCWTATICKSSCIFTIVILYLIKIHLVGDNMEIHLILTLWSNFKPLVSRNLAKVPFSKGFLDEDEKYVYVIYNNPSSLPIKGWVEKNYIIRFVRCAMKCTIVTKGVTLDLTWVATLVCSFMNNAIRSDPKQINLLPI